MKSIPVATLLIWATTLLGTKLFPELFLKAYVQYPLVLLTSILLAASFWLQTQRRRTLAALAFGAIFCLDTALLLVALEGNYSAGRAFEREVRRGIPAEIAEFLAEAGNTDQAHRAAGYIYQHYAVAVPYLAPDRTLAVYSPTEADKKSYQLKAAENTHLQVRAMAAADQMLSAFFLLVLHTTGFLLILLYLPLRATPIALSPQGGF